MEQELKKLLEELCIKAYLSVTSIECEYEQDSKVLKFALQSDESNILIGKYGETLFALQQIFRLMASRSTEEELPHIILDVDGYRDNQVENALNIAKEFIRKMKATSLTSIDLPPMASYKRRAVHFYVVENHPELNTDSTGFGAERRIVISEKVS